MRVGDLVRNKHTVIDSPADERGIVVEVERTKEGGQWSPHEMFARVVWFNFGSDYESWMDCDDLEVINETR